MKRRAETKTCHLRDDAKIPILLVKTKGYLEKQKECPSREEHSL
jgi:hypothetical protein